MQTALLCRFGPLALGMVLLGLGLLPRNTSVPAAAASRCESRQLLVSLLARDQTGLHHERLLFGVINKGKQPCILNRRAPWLSAIGPAGVVALSSWRPLEDGNITVPSNHNRPLMAADQMVWFGVDRHQDNRTDYTQLDVRLAGVGRQRFALHLGGNSQQIHAVSALQRDARRWLDTRSKARCAAAKGSNWQGQNWLINLQRTLHCR